MNISVFGCGRWGSFIAWYLDRMGHKITLYGKNNSVRLEAFRKERTNGLVILPESVQITSDLEYACSRAEILVISIGSQSLRGFFCELLCCSLTNKTVVLCMKGLEVGTGKRLTEIAQELLPKDVKTAVWIGPGHVQDFVNGIPNCMVIDSQCETTKQELVHTFSSDLIRFYYGQDLLGNEIGAASKNVVGIAAGMLDGLNKTALKGALMSRGTREIARLIKAMGGSEISAYGLAHLGDYQATVFSPYSHNRMFGEKFVTGEPYGDLAEGAATTSAMLILEKQYKVELPICRAVDEVIHQEKEPNSVLSDLFLRSIKMEF